MLTILTPATSKALTTYEAVANEIGDVGATLIDALILRASTMIETTCGRSFALERVRETSPCVLRNGGSVTLSRWPVVEIHSVTANGSLLDDERYEVEAGVLTGAFGRVAVDYTAGYVLPGLPDRTLPHDIERAAIALVKSDYHQMDGEPQTRSFAVEGAFTEAFYQRGDPLAAVLPLLVAYRMPVAL